MFFCSQPRANAFARCEAEVVNELRCARVVWRPKERTFTSPGPCPLIKCLSLVALLPFDTKSRSLLPYPHPMFFVRKHGLSNGHAKWMPHTHYRRKCLQPQVTRRVRRHNTEPTHRSKSCRHRVVARDHRCWWWTSRSIHRPVASACPEPAPSKVAVAAKAGESAQIASKRSLASRPAAGP
jgi:hypothetical protein